MTIRARAIVVFAAAAACAACHRTPAAQEGAEAPPGEVWLTPSQVTDAKIEIKALSNHDVDDTILTSGVVSLEDVRTGHVFSPVTGRVVSIVAGLGQHVKKGD